jgi:hypothetical protein
LLRTCDCLSDALAPQNLRMLSFIFQWFSRVGCVGVSLNSSSVGERQTGLTHFAWLRHAQMQ